MSTPLAGLAPRTTVAGQVIQPTAMIDAKSEAAHQFANVLRTLVTRSVGAFHSENEQDAAMSAIANYEKSLVTPSVLVALHDEYPETARAAKEDVTTRVAPNATGNVSATISQSIDYNRLAAAVAAHMLAAQAAAQENPPEVPAE